MSVSRKNLLVCLLSVVVAVFLCAAPVHAQSGSFLDTIYQANEGETDESGLAPAPEAVEDNTATPEPDDNIKFACPGATSSSCGTPMTQAQLEQMIRQIIQQIMSSSGAGCGGRIIIIRMPCGIQPPTTTPQPQPQPLPQPQPQPQPQPNPEPTTGGIAGLKAEMRNKYSIDARDGDAQWSQRQLEEANKVLATLPACFRSHTKSIQRDGVYRGMAGVLGYVQMGIPTVHMMNGSCRDGTFQGTLVHEMAHTWQANNYGLTNQWQRQFWANGRSPNPPSVSSYGNTQPVEDMAESVRTYWQNGPSMKRSQPARYDWIKNNVMGGKEF